MKKELAVSVIAGRKRVQLRDSALTTIYAGTTDTGKSQHASTIESQLNETIFNRKFGDGPTDSSLVPRIVPSKTKDFDSDTIVPAGRTSEAKYYEVQRGGLSIKRDSSPANLNKGKKVVRPLVKDLKDITYPERSLADFLLVSSKISLSRDKS